MNKNNKRNFQTKTQPVFGKLFLNNYSFEVFFFFPLVKLKLSIIVTLLL